MRKALHYIYRNLRTGTFSLEYRQKVIGHPTSIVLENVKFRVSEVGRQRVLAEKKKHVHAKVGGEVIHMIPQILESYTKREVYYNPYKTEQFIDKKTKQPVAEARYVLCENNKVYILEAG